MPRPPASAGSMLDRLAGGRGSRDHDRAGPAGGSLSIEALLELGETQFVRYVKRPTYEGVRNLRSFLRLLSKTPRNMRSFGKSTNSLVPYLMGFGSYMRPHINFWSRLHTQSLTLSRDRIDELRNKEGEIDEDFFLRVFRRCNAHWEEHIERAVLLFKECIENGWPSDNTVRTRKYSALNGLDQAQMTAIHGRMKMRDRSRSLVSAVLNARDNQRDNLPSDGGFDDINFDNVFDVDESGIATFQNFEDGAASGGASSFPSLQTMNLSQLLPGAPSFSIRDPENQRNCVYRHVGFCESLQGYIQNLRDIFRNLYTDESSDFYTNVIVVQREIGINLTCMVEIIGPLCDRRLAGQASNFNQRFGNVDTHFGLIAAIRNDQELWNEFVIWFSNQCPYLVDMPTESALGGLIDFESGGHTMDYIDHSNAGADDIYSNAAAADFLTWGAAGAGAAGAATGAAAAGAATGAAAAGAATGAAAAGAATGAAAAGAAEHSAFTARTASAVAAGRPEATATDMALFLGQAAAAGNTVGHVSGPYAGPAIVVADGAAGPAIVAADGAAGPTIVAAGGAAGPAIVAVDGAAGPTIVAAGGTAGADHHMPDRDVPPSLPQLTATHDFQEMQLRFKRGVDSLLALQTTLLQDQQRFQQHDREIKARKDSLDALVRDQTEMNTRITLRSQQLEELIRRQNEMNARIGLRLQQLEENERRATSLPVTIQAQLDQIQSDIARNTDTLQTQNAQIQTNTATLQGQEREIEVAGTRIAEVNARLATQQAELQRVTGESTRIQAENAAALQAIEQGNADNVRLHRTLQEYQNQYRTREARVIQRERDVHLREQFVQQREDQVLELQREVFNLRQELERLRAAGPSAAPPIATEIRDQVDTFESLPSLRLLVGTAGAPALGIPGAIGSDAISFGGRPSHAPFPSGSAASVFRGSIPGPAALIFGGQPSHAPFPSGSAASVFRDSLSGSSAAGPAAGAAVSARSSPEESLSLGGGHPSTPRGQGGI